MATVQINQCTVFFVNFNYFYFLVSLLLTAPGYVDLCPGPFEDTQFDAVIDVETSDDCMDDEGNNYYCYNTPNGCEMTAKSRTPFERF